MNSLKLLKKNFSTSSTNSLNITHMANYFINYGQYLQEKDRLIAEKYQRDNLRVLEDLKEIQAHQKKIAEKNWALYEEKEAHKSYLHRELKFSSAEESLLFINLVKDHCEELDHHPEWTVAGNSLDVKLTSHTANNNVSVKDYELAAFISREYEQRNFNGFKYNQCNQKWVSNAAAIGLTVVTVYTLVYLYNLYRNYRITSRDFYFSKIKH